MVWKAHQVKSVALVGAGGAARGAILSLDSAGASEIFVLNRTETRANAMVDSLKGNVGATLSAHPFTDWPGLAPGAAALINATSAGMRGTAPLALDLKPLPRGAVVYDLVYNPVETKLVREARKRGLKAASGLSMLLHQAVPSFKALFGVTPKITPVLTKKLEKALHGA